MRKKNPSEQCQKNPTSSHIQHSPRFFFAILSSGLSTYKSPSPLQQIQFSASFSSYNLGEPSPNQDAASEKTLAHACAFICACKRLSSSPPLLNAWLNIFMECTSPPSPLDLCKRHPQVEEEEALEGMTMRLQLFFSLLSLLLGWGKSV